MTDIRDAFFSAVWDRAQVDPNLIVVTNDMDVFALRKIRETYRSQFIDVGVAEQNMFNLAAGLAATGKRVVVFGISSFLAFRAYEQLRVNIGSMGLPVLTVGIGTGFSFSYDGPTHFGIDDYSVLKTIPELTIHSPGGIATAKHVAQISLEAPGPVFVQLPKGPYPDKSVVISEGSGWVSHFEGSRFQVVCTGSLTPNVIEVVRKLRQEGIEVGLLEIFTLKPLPDSALEKLGSAETIAVVEEQASRGGLCADLAYMFRGRQTIVREIGSGLAGATQHFGYGSRTWHLERELLSNQSIEHQLREWISRHDPTMSPKKNDPTF